MIQKHIIFVTGLSGAGKSSLARELAKETNFPLFGIGNYHRELARKLGHSDIGLYIRKHGLKESYFDFFPEFKAKMVELIESNPNVIIEGVYSKELIDHLKAKFPKAKVTVFNIASSRHKRSERFAVRESITRSRAKVKMNELDRIKRRIGIQHIQRSSEPSVFVIKNNLGLNHSLKTMLNHLKINRRA